MKSPKISRGYGPQDLARTQRIAGALLEALARGEQADALADQLSDAVLDSDRIRLALEVRTGGAHAWRKAIELAALVMSQQGVGQGNGTIGG